MSQPTICIREMAKRRIRTEYRRAEPRLTRVLAHYAVYQRATSIIDNRHNAERIERSQRAREIIHHNNNEESQRLWRYSPVSGAPTHPPNPPSQAETLRWLLPENDETHSANNARRSLHIAPQYEPPVQQKTRAQTKNRLFNPLRQNPPEAKDSHRDAKQLESATVSSASSASQVEIHRKIIVLQMTQILLKALRKLGVFISHGHSAEEEPDVEAQIHVNLMDKAISCKRYPDYGSRIESGSSVLIVCGPGV